MAEAKRYILTLSCEDTIGIVAAVTSFLSDHDGFILESAQFGDASTNKFFMRCNFEAGEKAPTREEIAEKFTPIAEKFSMKWELYNEEYKPKLLLMVSKEGHCLNDLLHRWHVGALPVEIAAVIGNHEDLKPMADFHNIPFHHLPVTKDTKAEQEGQIYKIVQELNIDLVVLARYMQILSDDLCQKLRGRAINIHHSFLPSFKGAKPYHQAYDRGVKIIGATAHYVTKDLDEGPIIEQEVIRVDHTQGAENLRALGQDIERQVLARAVKYHTEQRVILNGHKTVVFT
jgi:formyltetrahydrofolate deformylase